MKPSIREIAVATAAHYGIPLPTLMGRHHSRWVAWPRQVAMYLSREMTDRSFPEIGEAFGRHHTTVVYAVSEVPKRFDTSNELADVLTIAAGATMLCRRRCERDLEIAHAMRVAILSPANDLPSEPEEPKPVRQLQIVPPHPPRRLLVIAPGGLGHRTPKYRPAPEKLRAGRV